MTTLDEQVIMAGFNTFIFLQIFKETVPTNNDLEKCDFQMKKESKYQEYYKRYTLCYMNDFNIQV